MLNNDAGEGVKDIGQMRRKQGGLIFIISAPSGTGKTTLVKEVMKELPGLKFSVSYTTRLPRANERDGEDYHFISPYTFQKMVEREEFIEWAEVLGNRYGTARIDVDLLESQGVDLILDIDTQGAKKLIKKIDHAVLIYVLPPSLKSLRERLERRGLDTPEVIKLRLDHAKKDMEEAQWYHYVVVNERIKDAVEKLRAIIIAERCRKEKDLILEERKSQREEHHGKDYC
jgi:guanylate kinase